MSMILFFVAVDTEWIGNHLRWLILRRYFFARSMAFKTIPESQGLMHIYHLRIFAVTDITCGSW